MSDQQQPNPRRQEANDLHVFNQYLHQLGLRGNVKKASLGYHAQITKDVKPIDPARFSSVDGQHVMLAFEDLKKKSIIGEFVFDVTETKV